MAAKRKTAKGKATKRKPAKRARARPRSKFTVARRRRILKALNGGRFRYTAAALAGVGERTLKEWISRGRLELDALELADLEAKALPEVTAWGEFYLEVLAAEAVAEDKALGVIVDIATDKESEDRDRLKAATWYLAAKYPRRYGSGARVEITGKGGGPVELDARDTLLEKLAAMARREQANKSEG